MPCHLLQLGGKVYTSNLLEQHAAHILEQRDNIFLVYETHLTIDLSKLGLTVGTQVLVAEALGYLEIAVEACNHKELLQGLRALRESIELTGIHTRGNHKVAGAFRSRTDKYWSFNLYELLCIEEVADKYRHTVTQLQIATHHIASKVKIAVLHTQVVATVGIVLDGEGRHSTGAKHSKLRHEDFDITRSNLIIFALSFTDNTLSLDAVFTTQAIGLLTQSSINRFVEDKLGYTITVTQIDKGHTTHLAYFLHPTSQGNFDAIIGKTKFATCFCSIHKYIY